jgi:hypothetical protein
MIDKLKQNTDILVVFLILGGILYLLVGTPVSNKYYSYCVEEGEVGTDFSHKWIKSSEISGYDDIPKSQREELPRELRMKLRDNPSWFTGTVYEDLDNSKKKAFRKAIGGNGSRVDTRIGGIVLYKNRIYRCGTSTGGA